MQLPFESTFFLDNLLSWFKATKRDLPWRKSYDPYHVWISEIMLQQTQMDRGVRYFKRWVKRFPEVRDVAYASEEEILKYWEGLGYYARARNLHKAAKEIVEKYSSVVPADYNVLLTLPGVGPYTAAAVASIAGNQDVAVVDANVNRIFARLLDIEKPVKSSSIQQRIKSVAQHLLPQGRARVFNQALMDFGGLVCTPKNPSCSSCPLQSICIAFKNSTVSVRPVLKPPPQAVYVVRYVAIIVNEGRIYMQKRAEASVWGGLWEFPGGEMVLTDGKSPMDLDLVTLVKKDAGLLIRIDQPLVTVSHQYTHHKITAHAYFCTMVGPEKTVPRLTRCSDYRWMTPTEMDGSACPSGVRKIIEHLKSTSPKLF